MLSRIHTWSLCSVLALIPAPSWAEAVPASRAASAIDPEPLAQDKDTSGDIVVTAQKRETRLEKTPLTISVIDDSFLESRGTVELQKIAATVPGLIINDGVAGLTAVALRGIGTASQNQMFEQSIGLFIDGVYNPKSIQYRTGLVDAERIEIIKGGQGVTFGESTSVGAVSIVTKQPGDSFGGYAQGRYEPRYNSWDAMAAVDVPLSDTAAVRIVGSGGRAGGFVRNRILGQDGPHEDRWLARGTLRIEPTDALTIVLKGEASSVDTDLDGYVIRDLTTNPASLAAFNLLPTDGGPYRNAAGYLACGTTCGQYRPGTTLVYSRDFPRHGTQIDAQNALLNVQYEFGGGITFTSVTGWQHFKYRSVVEIDLVPAPIYAQTISESFRQLTQELRLTSPGDGKFRWLAGLFAMDQRDDLTSFYDVQNFFINGLGLMNGTSSSPIKTKSDGYAAFGQASYTILPGLSLTGGARISRKSRDGSFLRTTTPIGGPNGITFLFTPGTVPTTARIADTAVDYSASAEYDTGGGLLLYASFSHGNKLGAFNNARANGLPVPTPFVVRPQTSDSYEAGFKYRSGDGKFYLGAAAYMIDLTDFQDAYTDTARLALVVGNIDAKTRGFELETRANITPDFSASASYNYTKARLANGTPMQRAPEHAVTVGGRWTADLSPGVRFGLEPTLSFQSRYLLQSPFASGNNVAKGRENLDIRASLRFGDGIELSVLAENLTNSIDVLSSYGNPFGLGTNAIFNRPRTFTAGIKVPFGN